MKVYISGKITGNPNYMQEFQRSENRLVKEGYEVVNPTKIIPFDESKDWSDYMKEDIKALMDCDAIYMIHGWWTSKGARIEHELAKNLDMKVIYMINDIYNQYVTGQLPHVSISGDSDYDIFHDALTIQSKRIEANLQKAFPEKSGIEIIKLMFSDVD